MPCEAYKQALTDAAAANEAPSGELRVHLDGCAACRTWFNEEWQLFRSIDSGVHSAANSEMPASLLPRVRAGLDKESVGRLSWAKAGLIFASAVLVALVTGVFVHKWHGENHGPSPAANTVARNSASEEIAVPVVHGREPEKVVSPVATKHGSPRARRNAGTSAEISVLVPPGQRAAMDALLVELEKGTVKLDVLLVEKNAQPVTEELSPLGIPEIQIKPLAPVGDEAKPPARPADETSRF
jgi:predicted anti-sigma-YlaC factor YlaD